ncbi:MAG TPA: Na-translocating system protein MpsC family protein [Thermoleophilaceae bacterium]|nr:Na-translocating system protein MpsC family protein [Thermoleophilaceae bacterium]
MSSDTRTRIHCLRPLPDLPEPAGPRPSEHPSQPGYTQGDAPAAITRAIVGLLRRRTGRGPPKAKTLMSSDLAIVTLGDCLTAAEKTLAREGHSALATQFRDALHDGMRAEAVAAVQAITGRQVTAYLSAHEHDPELAVIAFHLGPHAGRNGLP